MSDLISRQAAIDRINKQREHLRPDIYEQDYIGDAAYKICAEFIRRLPSAQQWIPISEKKPEDKKIVLVCSKNGKYHIGFRYDDNWWFQDIDRQIREKHILPFVWAYLPEPWEGGNNESIH